MKLIAALVSSLLIALSGCAELEAESANGPATVTATQTVTETQTATETASQAPGSNDAPDVAFSTDETRDRITVVTARNDLTYGDFEFKASSTVKFDRNAGADSSDPSVGTAYRDLDAAAGEPFNAGDYLDFCGPMTSPTTFQIRHKDSGQVVYETTLNTVQGC